MQAVTGSAVSRVSIPQKAYIQPGMQQQNLSGSDTDVSTSTENLTAEERSVLRNGIRQEPQGEETIESNVDASSMNTLIIHNNSLSGENSSLFYGHGCIRDMKQAANIRSGSRDKSDKCSSPQGRYSPQVDKTGSQRGSPRSSSNGSVPSSPKCSQRKMMYNMQKPPCHGSLQQCSPAEFIHQSVPHHLASLHGSYYMAPNYINAENVSHQEMADIQKQYFDQSEVLKHLTKEINYQMEMHDAYNYPPPPEYPKWQPTDYCKMMEASMPNSDGLPMYSSNHMKTPDRFSVSRSHPDLSHLGKACRIDENCAKISNLMQRPEMRGRVPMSISGDSATYQANQMIELLSSENVALKNELDLCYKKVSKLQKFELEIQKVHQSHEEVVRSTEKREKLERAIRMRLEMEIRRLQEQNKELKEHLDSATSHLSKRPLTDMAESELRKELSKREVLVAQLLTQNKELMAEKEQQEILLQAQRATLQEQRNHIDILDNALTNAQINVVKLEEENCKKQVYVERVAQLQKALTSLQQSSERRLQMEKKVRLQLEKEVEALRQQKGGQQNESPTPKDENENEENLKKTVLDYEKKIIRLEAEVSKWEQRYIEESTMRQIAVDAASVPKDAKIAALERTSQESEKLIAQARTEKLKHMDELYAANRKCAELEGRIKDFESKLAEKDAMIKVLQQHSQSKDAVLQNAVMGRPPRHARAASTVGLTTSTSHTTTTTDVSCLGRTSPSPTNMLHRRAGSKIEMGASGSLLSISSDASSTTSPTDSSPVTDMVTGSKSLDEQLKDLDSRLSRLNYQCSEGRERKVPESLLESVTKKFILCK